MTGFDFDTVNVMNLSESFNLNDSSRRKRLSEASQHTSRSSDAGDGLMWKLEKWRSAKVLFVPVLSPLWCKKKKKTYRQMTSCRFLKNFYSLCLKAFTFPVFHSYYRIHLDFVLRGRHLKKKKTSVLIYCLSFRSIFLSSSRYLFIFSSVEADQRIKQGCVCVCIHARSVCWDGCRYLSEGCEFKSLFLVLKSLWVKKKKKCQLGMCYIYTHIHSEPAISYLLSTCCSASLPSSVHVCVRYIRRAKLNGKVIEGPHI